jgi:extradiol dioxygenase family protein
VLALITLKEINMTSLFHLAFNVRDLDQARDFYVGLLGCKEGRSAQTWVDINFFGHQLSMHLGEPWQTQTTGNVGDNQVPMPHFGAIIPLNEFSPLAHRLLAADIQFDSKPMLRFAGEAGEQYTMFFRDPFGNPIEIKAFSNQTEVFAL